MRYYYKVFGLVVESDIEFKQLMVTDEESDVIIALGHKSETLRDVDLDNGFCIVRGQELILNIPNKFIVFVNNGTDILVELYNPSAIDEARLFVLGTCLGAILMQRGIIPFHGGALHYRGKTILILGESGSGKSTLSSALVKEGAQILSDDVIPILKSDESYLAVSSYPQQKLWIDAIHSQGINQSELKVVPYVAYNREKFYINRVDEFYEGQLKIDYVFNLAACEKEHLSLEKISGIEEEHILLEEIRGMEKVQLLLNNIYRKELIDNFQLLNTAYEVCAGVAKQAKIYFLSRVIAEYTVDEAVSLIDGVLNMKGYLCTRGR